jgi:hypothetical protein
MNVWDSLNKDQKARAEETFDALSTLNELRMHLAPTGNHSRRISFDDLYKYVTGTRQLDQTELSLALSQDKKLSAGFDRLLHIEALYYMPQAAAASSDEITEREGEGFVIRLKPSRATPDQIYIIIEFKNLDAKHPSRLFIMPVSGKCSKLDLSEGSNNVLQIVAESSSDLVINLRDPGTEFFLR